MRQAAALSILLLAGCANPQPSAKDEPAPRQKPDENVGGRKDPAQERSTRENDETGKPFHLEHKGPIKGDSDSTSRDTVRPNRTSSGDELVRTQRERMARDPASDLEKLRLALLLMTAGDAHYPEAERVLATIRAKGDLHPYLEAWLYRKLGETQKANQLHTAILDDWRQAEGFRIERAELVTSVKGFGRFEPHPDGKITPGGQLMIYVQPRNFGLKKEGDRYTLHLVYDWRLFDERNQEIALPEWDKCNPAVRFDVNRYNMPISEFHQWFVLPLPKNLAVGNYRVRVTVKDKSTAAEREDRIYISFYVVPI